MPCSLAAERALLGSVLIDPSSIVDIAAKVSADDFYVQEHKQIFLAMRELFDASQEIDPVTLIDSLVHKGVYEKSGGEGKSDSEIKVCFEHDIFGDGE